MRADEARKVYEDLSKHSSFVGAYSFVSHEAEKRLHLSQRQTAIASECVVQETDHGKEPKAQVLIRAPSAWHAVIHLLVENRGWLSGRTGLGRQMALLYRGQRRSDWELTPALSRPGFDIEEEKQGIYAFVDLMERFLRNQAFFNLYGLTPSLEAFSGSEEPIPKVVHVATAQHYGFRTPMLDFTTDPGVAVWFACRGSKLGDADASVFALPSRIGEQAGAALVLPHPYSQRLYRQRGVFVQPPIPVGDWLRGLSVEVRFPPAPEFRCLRDGQEVDLLPEDPWWDKLVSTARDIAARGRVQELLRLEQEESVMPFFGERICELSQMFDELDLLPRFLERGIREEIIRDAVREFLQMALSLTTAMRDDTPRVSRNALRLFENNGPAVKALLPLVSDYVTQLPEGTPIRKAAVAMTRGLKVAIDEGWRNWDSWACKRVDSEADSQDSRPHQ
jgi:hypothetical protein